jgi:hypothetical protein
MHITKFGTVLVVAAVLHGCANTVPRDPAPTSSNVSYPSDPTDEARQISTNVVAYLTCTCMFVEASTQERCLADLPEAMNKIVPDIDREHRSVNVTLGRWSALAQDRGQPQGCQLR